MDSIDALLEFTKQSQDFESDLQNISQLEIDNNKLYMKQAFKQPK